MTKRKSCLSDTNRDEFEKIRGDLFDRVIEQSYIPLLITDARGDICYVNAAFTDHTGYALDEICGKNPRILKSGMTPLAVYEKLWQALAEGRVWQGDLCNRKKSGETYWESIVISPLKDKEGKVTHYVGIWQDVTDKKFDEAMIKSHAKSLDQHTHTDDLTGLYNPRHIQIELEREVERALRYERSLSGMIVDIRDFKGINHQYGQIAGDHVLKNFATVLEQNIRKVDILGRYRGDEFLLILPEAPLEVAKLVAERLLKNIVAHTFTPHGDSIKLAINIGLITIEDNRKVDRIVFLEKLDQALLSAKESGKNQITALLL